MLLPFTAGMIVQTGDHTVADNGVGAKEPNRAGQRNTLINSAFARSQGLAFGRMDGKPFRASRGAVRRYSMGQVCIIPSRTG